MNEQRTGSASSTPHRWRRPKPVGADAKDEVFAVLPMPLQLSWLLVQPVSYLSKIEVVTVVDLKQDENAAVVAELARRFTAHVRTYGIRGCPVADARRLSESAASLDKARACGVHAMATFAAGIEQDGAAVRRP